MKQVHSIKVKEECLHFKPDSDVFDSCYSGKNVGKVKVMSKMSFIKLGQ
jgi:hypothetical protein